MIPTSAQMVRVATSTPPLVEDRLRSLISAASQHDPCRPLSLHRPNFRSARNTLVATSFKLENWIFTVDGFKQLACHGVFMSNTAQNWMILEHQSRFLDNVP